MHGCWLMTMALQLVIIYVFAKDVKYKFLEPKSLEMVVGWGYEKYE